MYGFQLLQNLPEIFLLPLHGRSVSSIQVSIIVTRLGLGTAGHFIIRILKGRYIFDSPECVKRMCDAAFLIDANRAYEKL